jgi:hypothetical protein
MRFINYTGRQSIEEGITLANENFLPSSELMVAISLKDDWRFNTNMTGNEVVATLRDSRTPIAVRMYTSKNPFTKAIAYYDGTGIYFNTRKFSGNPDSISRTLNHEWAHYCGFSHGNNTKTREKALYSVPYFISEFNQAPTVYRKPWWKFW